MASGIGFPPFRMMRNSFLALTRTVRGRLQRGPLRPSWSFQEELLFAFLRADWSDLWQVSTPPELRSYLEALPVEQSEVNKFERVNASIGGVPGVWFHHKNSSTSGPVLIYYHGGSYLFGSTKTHADVIARFASATGISVFAPEYRLAPEHPWPAPLEDALAVYRELAPRGVAVAGESAGGHLVLALSMALRDAKEPLPRAVVSVSPWIDLEAKSPSQERHAAFDYGSQAMLQAQGKLVAGARPVREVSLVDKDCSGLGPLLVQVGGAEILFDEVDDFVTRAKKAGSSVQFDVLEDMPHAVQNMAPFVAAGRAGILRAAAFIKEHLPAS